MAPSSGPELLGPEGGGGSDLSVTKSYGSGPLPSPCSVIGPPRATPALGSTSQSHPIGTITFPAAPSPTMPLAISHHAAPAHRPSLGVCGQIVSR
jgi:hypothetical protein